MKKAIPCTALALMLILSACGNNTQSAAASTTTAAVTAETTTAAQTTTAETTAGTELPETEPEKEAETTAASGFKVTKTVIYTGIFDKKYYLEDAADVDENGLATYDTALLRYSTGVYHDSDSEPELFDTDELRYGGATADVGTVVQVKKNDVMGALTVNSAKTELYFREDEENGGYYGAPLTTEVTLDGEITVTGIIRYYSVPDPGTVDSGDVLFIPDSSYRGLPMPIDPPGTDTMYGTLDMDYRVTYGETANEWYWGGNVCVYSDAPRFRLGNLNYGLSDNTELIGLLGDPNEDCTKRVEVTLGDIALRWNDQFGSSHTSASIKSIKAI